MKYRIYVYHILAIINKLFKVSMFGFFLLLIFINLLCSPLLASPPIAKCRIEFLHNKLTVDVENISLSYILEKIQEKTNVEFVTRKDQCECPISVKFQSLSLDKAFKKILDGYSCAFISERYGIIKKVIILGKYNNNRESTGGKIKKKSIDPEMMIIEPAGNDEMKITFSSDTMLIEPPKGKEMEITQSSSSMLISPPDLSISTPNPVKPESNRF